MRPLKAPGQVERAAILVEGFPRLAAPLEHRAKVGVQHGQIGRLALSPGRGGTLMVQPADGVRIGSNPAGKQALSNPGEIRGSALGVIIDARGRPLSLPDDPLTRQQRLWDWLVALGVESGPLPYGVADLFEAWLGRHFPERAAKVMSRVRALRGGRRNDARFHSRLRGEGVFAEQIASLFDLACRRAGVNVDPPQLSTAAFRRPGGQQLALL